MTVVKKQSLKELLYLQERMNRAFEESIRDKELATQSGQWVPLVDIFEDDESIVLRAELPGVKKEDIILDVSNGVLTLSGKKQFRHEEQCENYHMMERQYGTFRRSFSLPDIVDVDKIDAKYERGVLEVVLPKTEGSISHQIPISEGK